MAALVKANPKPKAKPKIDLEMVENLARLGSPPSEIADFLGVSEDRLDVRNPLRRIAKGRASRHIRLRKLQWDSAENGSVPMQTFLGKHELGQGAKAPPAADQKVVIRRGTKRA